MRLISDDILDLVAGGRKLLHAESTATVYITGTPPIDPGTGPMDPNPTPSNGSSYDPPPPAGTHHSTPVPAHAPANVNMDDLRNTALDLANKIATMAKADGKEHGALIVRTASGALREGEISTGTEGKNTSAIYLSPGETVVAWVHDHPETLGMDERMPSKDDINNDHQLATVANVDRNMMMYIVDMASLDTFEYQQTVNNTNVSPGPNINQDF